MGPAAGLQLETLDGAGVSLAGVQSSCCAYDAKHPGVKTRDALQDRKRRSGDSGFHRGRLPDPPEASPRSAGCSQCLRGISREPVVSFSLPATKGVSRAARPSRADTCCWVFCERPMTRPFLFRHSSRKRPETFFESTRQLRSKQCLPATHNLQSLRR